MKFLSHTTEQTQTHTLTHTPRDSVLPPIFGT